MRNGEKKEKTPQEIADTLSEKALEEIDKLIKITSEYACHMINYDDCPKNPLEISKCDARVKQIELILSTTNRAKNYINSVSTDLDNISSVTSAQSRNRVAKEVTSRINIINSYESIAKAHQDLCPLSKGIECEKYNPRIVA